MKGIDRKTRPAPKPKYSHPAAIELQSRIRQIAQEANFATGGDFGDKVGLTFAMDDARLKSSIEAVRAAYPKDRLAVSRIISAALATRNSDQRAVAITTKAIRHNRGGRF